ncbi:8074_t:CDS:2 [Dentiscutata erythropus]|uniref:8074_t:CDS:1 n=1 Tax=Dentiscutata erythropus TaxID=1348616 RepID=A0A9N8YUE9_9GLOM|nr:8074_t:CDS:2 [Dentiscutata erythropus]
MNITSPINVSITFVSCRYPGVCVWTIDGIDVGVNVVVMFFILLPLGINATFPNITNIVVIPPNTSKTVVVVDYQSVFVVMVLVYLAFDIVYKLKGAIGLSGGL